MKVIPEAFICQSCFFFAHFLTVWIKVTSCWSETQTRIFQVSWRSTFLFRLCRDRCHHGLLHPQHGCNPSARWNRRRQDFLSRTEETQTGRFPPDDRIRLRNRRVLWCGRPWSSFSDILLQKFLFKKKGLFFSNNSSPVRKTSKSLSLKRMKSKCSWMCAVCHNVCTKTQLVNNWRTCTNALLWLLPDKDAPYQSTSALWMKWEFPHFRLHVHPQKFRGS